MSIIKIKTIKDVREADLTKLIQILGKNRLKC